MSFSKNLKFLRKQKKLSQDYIAERLGYKSFTTIQKWESGIAEPSVDKLRELSEIFDVSMDELLNKDLSSKVIEFISRAFKIPVLGRVVAGIPIEAIEEILDYEEIDESLARTGEFFALQVKGDSMEPRMLEGDVVIVRKQESVNSGDIAIVLVNGDEATVKRVRILDSGLMLIPFNSKYVPWTYTAEEVESRPVQIIGKVVELRGKF